MSNLEAVVAANLQGQSGQVRVDDGISDAPINDGLSKGVDLGPR